MRKVIATIVYVSISISVFSKELTYNLTLDSDLNYSYSEFYSKFKGISDTLHEIRIEKDSVSLFNWSYINGDIVINGFEDSIILLFIHHYPLQGFSKDPFPFVAFSVKLTEDSNNVEYRIPKSFDFITIDTTELIKRYKKLSKKNKNMPADNIYLPKKEEEIDKIHILSYDLLLASLLNCNKCLELFNRYYEDFKFAKYAGEMGESHNFNKLVLYNLRLSPYPFL